MKLILINAVPIALIFLTGCMVFWGSEGWGWPLAGALLTTVTVKRIKE